MRCSLAYIADAYRNVVFVYLPIYNIIIYLDTATEYGCYRYYYRATNIYDVLTCTFLYKDDLRDFFFRLSAVSHYLCVSISVLICLSVTVSLSLTVSLLLLLLLFLYNIPERGSSDVFAVITFTIMYLYIRIFL